MAWSSPATAVTGDIITAAFWNTNGRDNLNETGPAKVTAAGDLLYASGANALTRLAKGSAYQTLQMNAGATAPSWVSLEINSAQLTDTTLRSMTGDGNWNDITGYTVSAPSTFTATRCAIAVAQLAQTGGTSAGQTRLLIDDTVVHTTGDFAQPALPVTPMSLTLIGRKLAVGTTCTVKLQHYGAAAANSGDYSRLDLLVLARQT